MEIAEVLKSHSEILFAYLYGSTARGEADKKSDVDIGIFVRGDFEVKAFYEIEIAMEIERKCGLRGVEVVVLNKLLNKKPLRFLNQVLRYGKLIFSRDEKARIAFETYITKAYIDFLPHYREYDRLRFKA